MAVNENIWGTPETWDNVLHENAKTSHQTMWQKVLTSVLPMNQLVDNSPCFVGALGNWYIANPICFDENEATFPLYDVPGNKHDWLVIYNSTRYWYGYNGSLSGYNTTTKWSTWQSPDMPDTSAEYFNRPLFNFKIKKVCLLPYVHCQADTGQTTEKHMYPLGEYIASHAEQYPYITGVCARFLYDSSDTDTPDWIDAADHIDDQLSFSANYNFSDEFKNSGIFNTGFDSSYSVMIGATNKNYIYLMGFKGGERKYISRNIVFIYCPVGLDPDPTHYVYNDDKDYVMYLRRWSDELKEEIYTQLAFSGFFFIGEGTNYSSIALNDQNMFLGTIESDNCTHGNYTRGEDNENSKQWQWEDTSDSEYDPDEPEPPFDPNAYDGSMGSGLLYSFSPPTDIYNISDDRFINLVSKLWDAMALVPAGDPLNDYVLDTFLTTNPIDSILSCKYFPVSIDLGGSSTTVKLGKFDTEIQARKLLLNMQNFDCGNILVFPTFGNGNTNWIDKLTTIILYLPFCGSVQLDPELYMNRYVNVEYAIDILTGNCSAYVSFTSDNGKRVITDIASGNCAIDMPITGIQHITLDSQLYNATEQIKAVKINNAISGLQQLGGLGAAIASGNPMYGASNAFGFLGSAYNAVHGEEVAEYNLQHTQLPIKMIGTTGATTGAMCELYPTIIFERPVLPDSKKFSEAAYASTVGYACCISSTVSAFKGYTEFANVEMNFEATAQEKAMLQGLLKQGVIIKPI